MSTPGEETAEQIATDRQFYEEVGDHPATALEYARAWVSRQRAELDAYEGLVQRAQRRELSIQEAAEAGHTLAALEMDHENYFRHRRANWDEQEKEIERNSWRANDLALLEWRARREEAGSQSVGN